MHACRCTTCTGTRSLSISAEHVCINIGFDPLECELTEVPLHGIVGTLHETGSLLTGCMAKFKYALLAKIVLSGYLSQSLAFVLD